MLPNCITKQPDAIEKLFCIPFEELEKHEMNKELAEIFITLLMTKADKFKVPEKEKPQQIKMIEQSIKFRFSFTTTDERLVFFIAAIAESIGVAIMCLTFIQFWCKKNNIKNVDLELFGNRILPMGYPDKQTLHKLWEAQKVERDENRGGSDNLLDYQSAAKTIQFLQEGIEAK